MNRRWLAAVAAIAVACPPAALAGTSTEPSRSQWRRYEHDPRGAGLLAVGGRIRATAADGATLAYALRDAQTGSIPIARVVDVAPSSVGTYGVIGNHTCALPVQCTVVTEDGWIEFTFTVRGPHDPSRRKGMVFYLGAIGAAVDIQQASGTNWRGASRTAGVQRITSAHSSGAGIAVLNYQAGAETGASARGGDNGSLAIAVPPCEIAGAGVIQLHGPAGTVTGTCLTGPVAAMATTRADWTVTGATAGLTQNFTRLFTFDI